MKKSIVVILIFSFLIQVSGCYSSKYISKDEFLDSDKGDIIVLTNTDQYYSVREGWYFVKNDTIFIDSQSKYKINPIGVTYIALKDVKEIQKKEYNQTNTAVMITASVVIIAALIPFVSYYLDRND